MKRGLPYLLLAISLAWGCTQKTKIYTRQEMEHITDSITQQQVIELKQQAQQDLELRLPIELKPKVDSLLQLQLTPNTIPQMDTTGALPDSSTDNTL